MRTGVAWVGSAPARGYVGRGRGRGRGRGANKNGGMATTAHPPISSYLPTGLPALSCLLLAAASGLPSRFYGPWTGPTLQVKANEHRRPRGPSARGLPLDTMTASRFSHPSLYPGRVTKHLSSQGRALSCTRRGGPHRPKPAQRLRKGRYSRWLSPVGHPVPVHTADTSRPPARCAKERTNPSPSHSIVPCPTMPTMAVV